MEGQVASGGRTISPRVPFQSNMHLKAQFAANFLHVLQTIVEGTSQSLDLVFRFVFRHSNLAKDFILYVLCFLGA